MDPSWAQAGRRDGHAQHQHNLGRIPVLLSHLLLRRLRFTGRARARHSTLAVSAQLDSFTEVKKAINKMITNLKVEGEADFAKKASCTHDLGTASKNSQSLTIQKVDLSSKFDQLKKTIAILTADTAATQNAITEERPEVLKRGEQRDSANAQPPAQIVSDQQTTQLILRTASDRLGDASLAQGSQATKKASPP